MWKLVLFIPIFTLFIYTKNVYSLLCYVSDFESIKLGNIKKLNHTLQECKNYNNQVKELSQELQIPENVTFHCYTVEVSRDIVVKGCVQKGGCSILVDIFQNIARENGAADIINTVECTECNSNNCNNVLPKYLQIEPTPVVLAELRGATSLKCYYCSEPCKISQAREKICGQNIGKSYEAVCSAETAIDSETPNLATRKYQVVQKDQQPMCPENSVCTFCKTDLCNKEVKNEGEAALKCHFCLEACEVSKAVDKVCGQTIGDSQEAVCTTEVPKDSKTPKIAIRKCQIVSKGQDAPCPPNSVCTSCKSELCNSAPITSSSVALIGIITTFFAVKFLLN